jgi:hypothetical protein
MYWCNSEERIIDFGDHFSLEYFLHLLPSTWHKREASQLCYIILGCLADITVRSVNHFVWRFSLEGNLVFWLCLVPWFERCKRFNNRFAECKERVNVKLENLTPWKRVHPGNLIVAISHLCGTLKYIMQRFTVHIYRFFAKRCSAASITRMKMWWWW